MNSDRRGFFKRLFGLGAAVAAAKVAPQVLTQDVTAAASHAVQSMGTAYPIYWVTSTTAYTAQAVTFNCTWVEVK